MDQNIDGSVKLAKKYPWTLLLRDLLHSNDARTKEREKRVRHNFNWKNYSGQTSVKIMNENGNVEHEFSIFPNDIDT